MADSTPLPSPGDGKSLPRRTVISYEAFESQSINVLGPRTTYYYEPRSLEATKNPLGTRTTFTYCSQQSRMRKVDKYPNPTQNAGVQDNESTLISDVVQGPSMEEQLPDLPNVIQFLPDPDAPDAQGPQP